MNLQENIQRIKEVMGLNENDEVKKQLEWLRNYIKSPQYMERLKQEFPGKDKTFLEKQRDERYKNLDNVEYRTHFVKSIGKSPGFISGLAVAKKPHGYSYDNKQKKWISNSTPYNDPKGYNKPGHVYLEKEYDPKTWNPTSGYEFIPGHEYSHVADDVGRLIPQQTIDKIYNYVVKAEDYDKNYKIGDKEFGYLQTPTEVIARLQAIRYLLHQLKLYNPYNDKFTEQVYQKMITNPKIKNDQHLIDLLKVLKGNDSEKKKYFIDLMNTVAYNAPTNTEDYSDYA